MGITFSKIGGAIKRAVSPKARAAHKAQQQRIQERMAQAKEIVMTRRAGQDQEVTELINRVQDEVNLDEFTKMKSAPTQRPSQDQFIKKFPSVPRHRPGNSST